MDGETYTGVMETTSRTVNTLKDAFKRFKIVIINKTEYIELLAESKKLI